jgi:hypothetical protein
VQIFKNSWFVRFADKEDIDDTKLVEAVLAAERGLIDADLGGGVIKQRIARSGEGKSGGYRTILIFRKGGVAFFVYGFSKSSRDNITREELQVFKKLARAMLALSEEEIKKQVKAGYLKRVKYHGKG